jgi:hypothetical protein
MVVLYKNPIWPYWVRGIVTRANHMKIHKVTGHQDEHIRVRTYSGIGDNRSLDISIYHIIEDTYTKPVDFMGRNSQELGVADGVLMV